jgi:hypothetical protein
VILKETDEPSGVTFDSGGGGELRRIVSVVWVVALIATIVVASALPAFAERPTPPDVAYPNMGYCAPTLGQIQVRDDVNRLIKGGIGGYDNPGEIYSARAQSHDDYDCRPRQQ